MTSEFLQDPKAFSAKIDKLIENRKTFKLEEVNKLPTDSKGYVRLSMYHNTLPPLEGRKTDCDYLIKPDTFSKQIPEEDLL